MSIQSQALMQPRTTPANRNISVQEYWLGQTMGDSFEYKALRYVSQDKEFGQIWTLTLQPHLLQIEPQLIIRFIQVF